MTEATLPKPAPPPAPAPKVNRIGLAKQEYMGSESTLCAGCGHDAITAGLVNAFYDLGIEPHRLIKLSGIGCSSKTTAYFVSRAFGFNAVHGRMPSVATGAMVANRSAVAVGISGDGDTASIGIGQFVHLMRRNIPLLYIIEDNGVYGLTKGQFSATADVGSKAKDGTPNEFDAIDCCAMAIELGCGYVARSFSGDQKQLQALIKGAVAHGGTALIDVISPCVTFNNHEGSTKSLKYAKDSEEELHGIGFVLPQAPILVDFPEGTCKTIELADGSRIFLKKLAREYDPTNRIEALKVIEESHKEKKLLTGLYFIDAKKPTFFEMEHMSEAPLATLPPEKVKPSREMLAKMMKDLE